MGMQKLMIYGATGYTGRLVAAEAVDVGLWPVLAGRSAERLGALAGSFGPVADDESGRGSLETRVFGLDDPARIAAALADVDVVLHCAGPFSRTALPMFEACLATGTHYVDITGEIAVCEALAARDAEARDAGIMVLPAAGFDVVPSDCLIADLAARHPGGRVLRLGLAVRSGASRGTMKTVLESVNAIRIRRDGRIRRVDAGSLRHDFDFGRGPARGPGDVSGRCIDRLVVHRNREYRDVQSRRKKTCEDDAVEPVVRLAAGRAAGPGLAARDRSTEGRRDRVMPNAGRARGSWSRKSRTPTASASRPACAFPIPTGLPRRLLVAIGACVLDGDFKVGYQTPSSAYGADFVRQFEGVEWES